jgi:hypothetical protein
MIWLNSDALLIRVLGRGIVFDELYDGSGCSESSMSVWFHKFLGVFVERLAIGGVVLD